MTIVELWGESNCSEKPRIWNSQFPHLAQFRLMISFVQKAATKDLNRLIN